MKKIIPILFLFLSIFLCYIIYNLTLDDKIYIMSLGDNISKNMYIKDIENVSEYNTYFTNKDYRIIDVLNIIRYNQELNIDNKQVSIHQILKKADIIVLSAGMNDIYSKLNDNTKDIYTYSNDMINNMELLLNEINRYDHRQVFVLGYYNPTDKHDDIYTYLNYKLKRITDKVHFTYIDLSKVFKNNPKYLEKNDNFYLNNEGYKEIIKLMVENLKKY
ncbi:MAG: SGNH/GDSL hydrolase family protein [Bacilli bacterium]